MAAPSDARSDRRRRILDAAVALASAGGYDAVQMRSVAAHAEVALGTVYRYFPSKVQLLVAALARELERTQDRIDRVVLRGDTSAERLQVLVTNLTKALQRDRQLTGAMLRAYLFADGAAVGQVSEVARFLDTMLASAIGNTDSPDDGQRAVARIVSDCWTATLAGWATGRIGADAALHRMQDVVALVSCEEVRVGSPA